MSEVVAIVEGQTEQTFVRDQLAEHLGLRGIAIWAVLPGKTRRSGGVRRWKSAGGDYPGGPAACQITRTVNWPTEGKGWPARPAGGRP